ncbi:MAG: GGDEF domain-containing protein [Ilumatobacteraceae bacterium]|nr:GGDEF domain-containing protein [Ilumatobacteraceae bacterium]
MNADEVLSMLRPVVLTVSGVGEVLQSSGGFGGFFGHDPATFVGRNVFEYVTPSAHEELALYFIESGGESAQTASLPVPFRVEIMGADGGQHPVDVIASGVPTGVGTWDWVVVLMPLELQTSHARSLDAEMAGEPHDRIKQLLADEVTVDNLHYTTRAFFVDLSDPTAVDVTSARADDQPMAELIRDCHVDEGWAPWTGLAGGDTIPIADRRLPRRIVEAMSDRGWRRASVTAVRTGADVLGAFVVMGRVPDDYPVDVVMTNVRALFRRLADATELIMTRWSERERLTIAATRDSLTGLSNRAGLFAAMESRSELAISLLYIDVDEFKSVNDRYGHGIGDLVLSEIGRRLEGACRADSIVARFGGDEFVVVLSGVDDAEARLIGERMIDAVSAPLDIPGGPDQVTISVGVAPTTGGRLASSNDLIDVADGAMLHAKREGRARLVMNGGTP